jgi:tripartite-type tricarboxylate transporter receptor subunit TctC
MTIHARLLPLLTAVGLFLLATTTANAQTYPSRAVRVVVPFPPGGTDFIGRVVCQKLNEAWGQPVVVENRPGGTTVIGTDIVAKAPPDGYTLLVTPVPFAIVPSISPKLPYDPLKDFEPIALFNITPLVFVVNPVVPARSIKDLIALARAKPGLLNFATSGVGSSNHLAGELFNVMAGVKIVHVPYKGSAPAMIDLVGGHVDLAVTTLTSAVPLIKAGKLRPLAVTSLQRSPQYADIPTMDESGLKGFQAVAWNGLSAPARTPKDIVNRINADVAKALQSPDVIEKFRNEGAQPVSMSPAEFAAFIRDELAKWNKVVTFAKIESL